MNKKIINKKSNAEVISLSEKVASMVKHKVPTNSNCMKCNNYLNFSVYILMQRKAPVALMVKHWSNKPSPHGHSGSNPGWGASAFISGGFK